MASLPSVLITGASAGIGAVYADRFAKRGHDLVLVVRDRSQGKSVAERLHKETGVTVDILRADLTEPRDLTAIEDRLRDDARIGILVNNAGTNAAGGFAEQSLLDIATIIQVNTTAVTRLAHAVIPRFVRAGEGAIVNLSSVVGIAPEFGGAVYGATKAYVLFLTQGLHLEFGSKGVYVQAVLPAVTRTDIWERAGIDVNQFAAVMEAGDLVDAALVGFDRRETITIPTLPDAGQWISFETARQAMLPNFNKARAAARYQ